MLTDKSNESNICLATGSGTVYDHVPCLLPPVPRGISTGLLLRLDPGLLRVAVVTVVIARVGSSLLCGASWDHALSDRSSLIFADGVVGWWLSCMGRCGGFARSARWRFRCTCRSDRGALRSSPASRPPTGHVDLC